MNLGHVAENSRTSLHALKYLFIGLACAGLDWAFFCFEISYLGMTPGISNFISTNIGIFASFFANLKYNFKVNDNYIIRFLSFYAVGFVGYLFSHFYLLLGVACTDIRPEIIKATSILGVAIIQFIMNKAITFGAFVPWIMSELLNYALKHGLLGLSEGPLGVTHSAAVLAGAIGRTKPLFKLGFGFLLMVYVSIAAALRTVTLGRVSSSKIYSGASKIMPFKFLIGRLRSMYLLSAKG